jgi:hypothetical protein
MPRTNWLITQRTAGTGDIGEFPGGPNTQPQGRITSVQRR